MKQILLLYLIIPIITFAQKETSNNHLSAEFQFLHFNYKVKNLIGPEREIEGASWSYAFNVSYQKYIFKSLQLKGGIGYLNHHINIDRPFRYRTLRDLLFTTDYYNYKNIGLHIGTQYELRLSKTNSFVPAIVYHRYYTFRQVYKPQTSHKRQINTDIYYQGYLVNPSVGMKKSLNRNLSLYVNAGMPILRWRKDEIFLENENEFENPTKSLGFSIGINYHLK